MRLTAGSGKRHNEGSWASSTSESDAAPTSCGRFLSHGLSHRQPLNHGKDCVIQAANQIEVSRREQVFLQMERTLLEMYADPALDTGYFLAYLRPTGLWYGRGGARQWFEAAAASFRNAYREALIERGIDAAVTDGILERTRFYEAALLFKIATRRVNRLNSPRPGELAAMLAEIVSLTQ